MWSFFREREVPNNPRKIAVLFLHPASLTSHWKNSSHFRGTLIWNKPPSSITSSNLVVEFKTNLKQLGNIGCNCVI